MRALIGVCCFLGVSYAAQAACDANAEKLIRVYAEHLSACKDNHLIWKNGGRQLYDDGKVKSFEVLLDQADVQDMFAFAYPTGKNAYQPPSLDFDPGRVRNEEFFKRVYGATKDAVAAHLTSIEWLPKSGGKPVKIQSINGVAQKLALVSKELDALPKDLKKYVLDSAGTFNWRKISGSNRLSNHSFAIAIDIDTRYADYWQWAKGGYRYANRIPHEIVEIFEKHGFIWGGKWYHYDTMHFEYRPELL